MVEYELFYDKIKENNGVLRITIPEKLAKYANLSSGDEVKVMIKRTAKKRKKIA